MGRCLRWLTIISRELVLLMDIVLNTQAPADTVMALALSASGQRSRRMFEEGDVK